MADLQIAYKRLEIIYNDCSPSALKAKEAVKNLDDFGKAKKEIHTKIKNLRTMIKDRDDLMGSAPGTKESAEISHRIRTGLKDVREDISKIDELQKKEQNKAKKEMAKNPEVDQFHRARAEIVHLIYKHLEECENLERRRVSNKMAASGVSDPERAKLFEGATSSSKGRNRGDIELRNLSSGSSSSGAPPPYESELPDFDIENELAILNEGNSKIDKNLDIILNGVSVLKEAAQQMENEIDKQGALIDDIEKGVDKANVHVDSVNTKMKKTLEKAMKADKFMVNCVLVCILLAVIGFIASFLTQ